MKFEEGTLVKGAYVVIDGVEHEVHMPEYSGNTPLTPENLNKMQEDFFPVGSTYVTQSNTNPNTILGFGEWERLKGKVVVGLDENDADFNEIGKEIGEKSVALTSDNNGIHAHYGHYDYNNIMLGNAGLATGDDVQGVIINNSNIGNFRSAQDGKGTPHNNIQPTKVVGYMWIRTA